MLPEALEFVEMLLDLARFPPCPGVFHELEDELFHGECGLPLVERGPGSGPVRRQFSEAEDVAVSEHPVAAIRGIDMTDVPQEPHQRKERIASDPPGAKRTVKFETGTLPEDGLRSCRHAELDVAVRRSNPDQRIEKRVRTHDIPVRPMFLNQLRLGEARIKMGFCTLDLDTGGFLHDPV